MKRDVDAEIDAVLSLSGQSNLPEKPKRPRRQGASLSALTARSEAEVLRECLRYLKAAGIFCLRMNSGAMQEGGRFVRFGTPGCADILAFKNRTSGVLNGLGFSISVPVRIECKSSIGKQSKAQKVFQEIVERESHRYFVIRSVAELIAALSEV